MNDMNRRTFACSPVWLAAVALLKRLRLPPMQTEGAWQAKDARDVCVNTLHLVPANFRGLRDCSHRGCYVYGPLNGYKDASRLATTSSRVLVENNEGRPPIRIGRGLDFETCDAWLAGAMP